MHVEFTMTDSILIASVSGEIDHHNALELREEIDGTFKVFSGRHIIMDFKKVSFVDSSGIGVIMGRYNLVSEKKGIMVICGCSEYMRKILHMAGIFTIVRESDDVEEGISLIRSLFPENDDADSGLYAGNTESFNE